MDQVRREGVHGPGVSVFGSPVVGRSMDAGYCCQDFIVALSVSIIMVETNRSKICNLLTRSWHFQFIAYADLFRATSNQNNNE